MSGRVVFALTEQQCRGLQQLAEGQRVTLGRELAMVRRGLCEYQNGHPHLTPLGAAAVVLVERLANPGAPCLPASS